MDRAVRKIKSPETCTHQILPLKKERHHEDSDAVILVGNPNVGKSVIFGHLTGTYVTVSNYPGTTVEVAYGKASFDGHTTLIIDTPGVNNLIPMSEDEVVTRNILLEKHPRAIIQVADAKNLRRSLFLTVQLLEMGLPVLLDLNMVDEAQSRGISVDCKKLQELLGIPVVETVAIRRKGISTIIRLIQNSLPSTSLDLDYGPEIEEAIRRIARLLPDGSIRKRALALMLLSRDSSLNEWLHAHLSDKTIEEINRICRETEEKLGKQLRHTINQTRMDYIQSILENVLREIPAKQSKIAAALDYLMLHPVFGVAFVMLVLFLMYEFVGVFGAGTLVDFFEGTVFEKWLIPPLRAGIERFVPWNFFQDFLVGEYGMLSMALSYAVAIVLPIVATFFIAFSILEDSGYLPRLAVIVNRHFRAIGLNGKAVLPMVLGLGCDTMATLTTRILESKKERIIVTLLLALGVPCSAQLGVIMGLLGGLSLTALLIWMGTVLGVLLLVGFLSARVIPGESSDFIVELPPLRLPAFWNIFAKTVARIEWYLKEAVPLFFLGTFVLFTLDKLNLLGLIERLAAPLIQKFLQLPAKATEAFLIGFLRRDYGVAGLFDMAQNGQLTEVQIVVSLITITLFVPCIANFFIIIKERGWKTALAIVGFIFPFAFFVGGVINWILRAIGFGGG
jgi:ferrous iron transport protein B